MNCREFVTCGEPAGSDDLEIRFCARDQSEDSAYCLQHTALLRETAKSLSTSGDMRDAALLLHLTRPVRIIGNGKSPAIHTLEELQARDSGPSLGALDLSIEVVQIIVAELSLRDLRNFKAVNSRAHSIIISNPWYRNVITHAPAVVSALYKTELDSTFPLARIHSVLTQARCTICDRFGGYVFLAGLQRCCERCARYDPELIPLRLDVAKREFQISSQKAEEHLPMMLYAVGCATTNRPGSKFDIFGTRLERDVSEYLYLVSPGEAARVGRAPVSPSEYVRKPEMDFHKWLWYETAVPMPHLDPKTDTVTRGYRCKGCIRSQLNPADYRFRRWDCGGCQRAMPNGIDIYSGVGFTSRSRSEDEEWLVAGGANSCKLDIASGRLYTADELLFHLVECFAAQSMLADLARIVQSVSPGTETDEA